MLCITMVQEGKEEQFEHVQYNSNFNSKDKDEEIKQLYSNDDNQPGGLDNTRNNTFCNVSNSNVLNQNINHH